MASQYPYLTDQPVAPQPVAPLPDPMEFSRRTHDVLAGAIPGLDKLSSGASGVVNNLLGGLPSTSTARRAGAYFGARSGMPSSDFVRNRGFDLYNEQADKYQQRGFDDFLQLLRGTSGTIAPTPGEQLQSNQFDRNFQQHQTDQNQALAQFNVQRNDKIAPIRTPDSYTEYNVLGMRPLFGRGSGR